MAENLTIKILGDASKLTSELEKAGGHISGFSEKIGKIGKAMSIAGIAVTAAFGMIIKKTADAGDAFNDMSLRTGVSVEHLSTLAYACDLSGTSIEGMEIGLKFLTKGMDDASQGIGEAKDAFEYLGISVVDVEGNLRPTIDVLKEAATKISEVENPAKQAALAMELFGARSGTQLIPLLKEGGAGIDELMGKAKDLGIEMSTASAQAADEFNDKMTDLTGSLAGVGRTIGDVLIPALVPLIDKATEIVGKIQVWAEENPRLVETITTVGATIGVIAAVGGPILMAVSAFSKISGAISAIGVVGSGPIGLLILAIGAVVLIWKNWDTIITFVQNWKNKIIRFLTDLKDSAKLKVQEMVDWIIQKFEDLANLPEKMLEWGKNAITGFTDGIKDKMGTVTDAVKGVGTKIKNFLGFESPPIEGPLSGSDKWMPNMMGMLGAGITTNIGIVLKPVETMTNKMKEIFDDTVSSIVDSISSLTNTIESELSNALYDVLTGTTSFGDAWTNMWKNIGLAIIKQVSNIIAQIIIAAAAQFLLALGPIGWVILLGGAVAIAAWAASQSKNIGGEIKKFQFGGLGTDTVPTMLTPGEYVIAKPMTDFIKKFKMIPANLIGAISMGMPTPAPLAFAGGGSIGDFSGGRIGYGDTNINVYVTGNNIASELDVKKLATTVGEELLRRINLNRRH